MSFIPTLPPRPSMSPPIICWFMSIPLIPLSIPLIPPPPRIMSFIPTLPPRPSMSPPIIYPYHSFLHRRASCHSYPHYHPDHPCRRPSSAGSCPYRHDRCFCHSYCSPCHCSLTGPSRYSYHPVQTSYRCYCPYCPCHLSH